MKQILPRGFVIPDGKAIKRMIAEGEEWQIYITNVDSYVVAISPELYQTWIDNYYLPEGIFTTLDSIFSWKMLSSPIEYLISSIGSGPYPTTFREIEAFSIAFSTASRLYENADLSEAIYIEEYSLLLPTSQNQQIDNSVAYGKWITAGVNISIDSFGRVCELMTWASPEAIQDAARIAGFDVEPIHESKDGNNGVCEAVNCCDERKHKTQRAVAHQSGESQFSLVGRPDLEKFFNESIIDVVLNREAYQRMGIPFPGATILYGPPGCGKTFAVDMLAEYLGWPRFDIDSSSIASSLIHDTPKKISEVFSKAINAAPSILVIDEMEAFLSSRSATSHEHHVEEVAEFLRRIPEAISKNVLIFAMTNVIDTIDPAILRRGRFDHIIEVKMASAEEIEALLTKKLNELPVDETVNAHDIAKALDKHPLSDVTFVLREAGRYAVKSGLELMTEECFKNALSSLPKNNEKTKIGF